MTWFVLIALSPVLTYQHHVIDIVGGVVLAVLCFCLFR
jgi:membrane-associated phospholipid phosphatase